ncbi:hypothetical protein ACSMXM_05660 [Pacificimonas sp. ICDLI1SI03]
MPTRAEYIALLRPVLDTMCALKPGGDQTILDIQTMLERSRS